MVPELDGKENGFVITRQGMSKGLYSIIVVVSEELMMSLEWYKKCCLCVHVRVRTAERAREMVLLLLGKERKKAYTVNIFGFN